MSAANNWLILDKPLGLTSTQALSKAKRLFGIKKAGHAGTLDPLASGVLPIAFGEATKTIPFIQDAAKEYVFTISFGAATDTEDAEGKVIAESNVRPTVKGIEAVLPRFTGLITQIPPRYAAIKIDGKRAYDLAREGVEFEMKSREVEIYELALTENPPLAGGSNLQSKFGEGSGAQTDGLLTPPRNTSCFDPPARGGLGTALDEITLRVACSKGTYVRSLARDIAEAVGTVGHVSYLRRTKVGHFTKEQAISLDFLEKLPYEDRAKAMLPFATALDDIPALAVNEPEALKLRQGQKIPKTDLAASPLLSKAICNGEIIGLVEQNSGFWHPVRIFNL